MEIDLFDCLGVRRIRSCLLPRFANDCRQNTLASHRNRPLPAILGRRPSREVNSAVNKDHGLVISQPLKSQYIAAARVCVIETGLPGHQMRHTRQAMRSVWSFRARSGPTVLAT